MAEKRNYWIKIPKDFLERTEIRRLCALENGSDCFLIYIKMLLSSLDFDGKIVFDEIDAKDKVDSVSFSTRSDIDDVKRTVDYLKARGLLIETEREYRLTSYEEMVGSETESARRKRLSRASSCENQTEISTNGQTSCKSTENVREVSAVVPEMSERVPLYRDREELEVNLEREIHPEQHPERESEGDLFLEKDASPAETQPQSPSATNIVSFGKEKRADLTRFSTKVASAVSGWFLYKHEKKSTLTDYQQYLFVEAVCEALRTEPERDVIDLINNAITAGYSSVHFNKISYIRSPEENLKLNEDKIDPFLEIAEEFRRAELEKQQIVSNQ